MVSYTFRISGKLTFPNKRKKHNLEKLKKQFISEWGLDYEDPDDGVGGIYLDSKHQVSGIKVELEEA